MRFKEIFTVFFQLTSVAIKFLGQRTTLGGWRGSRSRIRVGNVGSVALDASVVPHYARGIRVGNARSVILSYGVDHRYVLRGIREQRDIRSVDVRRSEDRLIFRRGVIGREDAVKRRINRLDSLTKRRMRAKEREHDPRFKNRRKEEMRRLLRAFTADGRFNAGPSNFQRARQSFRITRKLNGGRVR